MEAGSLGDPCLLAARVSEDEVRPLLLPSKPEEKKPKLACTRRCLVFSYLSIVLIIFAAIFVIYIFPLLKPYHPHVQPSQRYPPDPPDPPTVGNVSQTSVQVSWNAPDARTAQILGYDLQASPGNNSIAFASVFRGAALAFTVASLFGGSEYCFRVCAVSSVGAGNYSQVSCATTLPASQPDPPSALFPLNTSTSTLDIGWPAAANHGAPVIQYELDMASDENATQVSTQRRSQGEQMQQRHAPLLAFNMVCTLNGTNTTAPPQHCSVAGLKAGATYYFRTRALNPVGFSNFSAPVTVHTDMTNATAPPAPDPPTLLARDGSSITVGWTPLPADNGAQVLSYELQIGANVSGDGSFHTVYKGLGAYSAMAPSLQASTFYCFRLRANNSRGAGAWSAVTKAACFSTMAGNVPSAPQILNAPLATSPLSISVGWSPPEDDGGYPIIAYELQQDDWWVDAPLTTIYAGSGDNFTAQTNLMPSVIYHFRVRANNSHGYSDWSPVVAFATDENGRCGNPNDTAVYKATKQTMKKSIQSCIISCIVEGTSCVVSCIHSKVGLSTNCAQCWADEGECTLHYCTAQCIEPTSAACQQCSETNCFPDCVLCSGIPRYFFPP